MKKKILILPLLMLILASCGVDSNSSSDDSIDSNTDASSETSTNSDVSSNTDAGSDTTDVNSGSTNEYGYYYSATWPSQVIATFLGSGITSIVPSFASPSPFYFYADYTEGSEYLEIYTEMSAVAEGLYFDAEVTYNSSLTQNGYTIDDSEYDEYGFFAADANESIFLQYYWWDGAFVWYISAY